MTGTAKWLFSHMYVVSMDVYACFLYVYACPHEIENMCAQLCIQMSACICGSQTVTYDCLWPNILNQDSHLKLRSPILVKLAKCSEDPLWCLSPALWDYRQTTFSRFPYMVFVDSIISHHSCRAHTLPTAFSLPHNMLILMLYYLTLLIFVFPFPFYLSLSASVSLSLSLSLSPSLCVSLCLSGVVVALVCVCVCVCSGIMGMLSLHIILCVSFLLIWRLIVIIINK